MTLNEYLKTLGKPEADDFATRCQTSVGFLRLIALGHRRAGYSLAVAIDRESQGAVCCRDLRPDMDWDYIAKKISGA